MPKQTHFNVFKDMAMIFAFIVHSLIISHFEFKGTKVYCDFFIDNNFSILNVKITNVNGFGFLMSLDH